MRVPLGAVVLPANSHQWAPETKAIKHLTNDADYTIIHTAELSLSSIWLNISH